MTHPIPPPALSHSLNPKDYRVIIVVSGTRKWADKVKFHTHITQYLRRFNEPVLFVSGAAPSGADRMIIQWCARYNYPCIEMPADWDTYGPQAGFVRNFDLLNIGTHFATFWDGVSPGTETQYRNLLAIVTGKQIGRAHV